MDPFTSAVTNLVVAASVPDNPSAAIQRALPPVLQAVRGAEQDVLDEGLRRMADVISVADVPQASLISIACGAIVEDGGCPDIAVGAILERLPEVMKGALAFARACEQAAAADPSFKEEDHAEEPDNPLSLLDISRYVARYGMHIAKGRPQGANCWMATEPMCMGTMAMLSRSVAARKSARANAALVKLARDLVAFHARVCFLHMMLQVLDDEVLLVIHVRQQRGYRVQIRGIADNFQLHPLLADALVGDAAKGFLAGERPDPRIVAVAKGEDLAPNTPSASGAFNLVNWTGLGPNGDLPEGQADHAHWIENEGIPADILPFHGTRVVLLSEPSYSRSWKAGRSFPDMLADLRVVEILRPDEVRQWIERIAREPKPPVTPLGGNVRPRIQ